MWYIYVIFCLIFEVVFLCSVSSTVNSIALVKPERAKQVEGMLIQMAQTGQISGQIGEAQLVDLLEKISQKTQKKTTIKFQRKKTDLDDSDDDF